MPRTVRRPAQVGGPKPGPSGWAQAGPKWVGPSWAQARNLGPKKIKEMKILKIKIRSAKNVGKVWISKKKSSWAISGNFSMDQKMQKNQDLLPISLGGPMASIQFSVHGSLRNLVKAICKTNLHALLEQAFETPKHMR